MSRRPPAVLTARSKAKQWMSARLGSRASRDFLMTAGTNFAIVALATISGILAARLLGPEGRGALAAALVWSALLGVVGSLGVPQALTYFAAQEPTSVGALFRTAAWLAAVQSLVVGGIGWFVVSLVLGDTQPSVAAGIQLYLFGIPPFILMTYLATLAQGLSRFPLFGALRLAVNAVPVAGLCLAVAIRTREIHRILLLLLILQWVAGLLGTLAFIRQIRPKGRFEWAWARRILGYGLKSYIGSVSWLANVRLDQFVMTAVVSTWALGQYAVAASYATALFPLSGAFAMVLYPRVAGGSASEGLAKIRRGLRLNLAITSAGAIIVGAAGPVLVPWLFGREFSAAVWPASVLLAGTVILGANWVLSDGLRGLGSPLATSLAEVAGVVVTLAGLWWALPRWGIKGAAVVSVLSYGAATCVLAAGIARVARRARAQRHDGMPARSPEA